VLVEIVTSRGTPEMVRASALGTLGEFDPSGHEWLVDVVKVVLDAKDSYLLSAAMTLLVRHAKFRKDLVGFMLGTEVSDYIQWSGTSALKHAFKAADTPEERKGIRADMETIASQRGVHPSVRQYMADWLSIYRDEPVAMHGTRRSRRALATRLG